MEGAAKLDIFRYDKVGKLVMQQLIGVKRLKGLWEKHIHSLFSI
jgi:hypothetical protein